MSPPVSLLSAAVAATPFLLCACFAGAASHPAENNVPHSDSLRVADCDGPAVSLPRNLRALLAPRTGQMIPDDHWADLAERIPGGFAGVLYSKGTPVLMLTRPQEAIEAKRVLALDPTFNGFDISRAQVRKARWDFAQLVDWYRYLVGHTSVWNTPGMAGGDKNEGANRIYFGIETEAGRLELRRKLLAVNVPCDLILIGLQSRATF